MPSCSLAMHITRSVTSAAILLPRRHLTPPQPFPTPIADALAAIPHSGRFLLPCSNPTPPAAIPQQSAILHSRRHPILLHPSGSPAASGTPKACVADTVHALHVQLMVQLMLR